MKRGKEGKTGRHGACWAGDYNPGFRTQGKIELSMLLPLMVAANVGIWVHTKVRDALKR